MATRWAAAAAVCGTLLLSGWAYPTTTSPAVTVAATTATSDGTQAAVTQGWGPVVAGDEFNTGSTPNPLLWEVYNSAGNAGQGVRSPSAVTVANGVLTISGDANGTTGGLASKFARQEYGRWEARMRTSARDPKYHPVMILWPDSNNSPTCAETDYAEGQSDTTRINFFLHYACSGSSFQASASKVLDTTQWHNYAVDWSPSGIIGYVDGVEWFRDTNPADIPSESMHQTLQLDWFPNGTPTTPTQMYVDWVRVYGAGTLGGEMDTKAASWGLGSATSGVMPIRDGGFYRNYQYGAVISTPWHTLQVSHGAIRGQWAALGFENGVLGYPTTDEIGGLRDGGVYQNYEGGAIIWSPATGAQESLGPIRAEWQQLGFEGGVLGYPTTRVVTGLVNGGSYQNYQGGAVVSSPASGTHESVGAIRSEWQSTGFEHGVLGYPTTDVVTGLANGGSYQNYQGGAIVSSPASGTHESYGPIRAAWQSSGFEGGTLGYPTSEVYSIPNGVCQDFQGGRISDINGTLSIASS
ncbi:MAG TPA: family 16 glycosylhydrolase [Sinomonas sp.]|nr:family 16 glycosylhydrolase [Sinomonas sp.]